MTDADDIFFQDQLNAAINHAAGLHQKIGEGMKAAGVSTGKIRACETGPVVDAIHAWQHTAHDNGLTRCPHIELPQPVFALLALPGYVACHVCSLQAACDYVEENPWTCDACGTEPADHQFQEVIVQVGPLIMAGNVCISCYQQTVS